MKKSFNERKNDNGPLQLHEKVIISSFSLCIFVCLCIWL